MLINGTEWRLVPVEPDLSMGLAGKRACAALEYVGQASTIYQAMLDVAPTPPAATAAPSDDDLLLLWEESYFAEPETMLRQGIIRFARALLSRYGQAPSDIEEMVRMLEAGEWAEHAGVSPLGKRLEAAITKLVGQAPAASACVGCEGKPAPENNPCAVCGKPAASAEPVAWRWKWEGYPWTYSDDPKPSPPMKGMIREPLYAAPVAAQAPAADGDALREAVKIAYGYLWHVNNEPGTPNQYAPERAAYKARIVLREQLTKDERGEGINVVRAAMQRTSDGGAA